MPFHPSATGDPGSLVNKGLLRHARPPASPPSRESRDSMHRQLAHGAYLPLGEHMRIFRYSASRMPLRNSSDRCSWCGNAVIWHDTFEKTRVPLIPGEFPAAWVPPRYHWHLNNGVAYLGADPSEYGRCRLKHSTFCPALPHDDLDPAMWEIVAKLRARMDKRIEEGSFTPAPIRPRSEAEVAEPDPADAAPPGSTRHCLYYHGVLRIAPGLITNLQCVATTHEDERCPNTVFDPNEGAWEQVDIPEAPGRAHQMILTATGGQMWVWTLDQAPGFQYISRWLRQCCPEHAEPGTRMDAAPLELVTFDPLRHGDFILATPPKGTGPVRHEPTPVLAGSQREDEEEKRWKCAGPGCRNTTVREEQTGWLCYQCARRAKRRRATHAKWQTGTEPRPSAPSPTPDTTTGQ